MRVKKTKKATSQKTKKSKAFKDDVKKVVSKAKEVVKKITASNKKKKKISAHSKTVVPKPLAKKPTESEEIEEELLTEVEKQDKAKSQKKFSGEAQIQFFYSNEKYFNSFDDKEILNKIREKYPRFFLEGNDDSEVKKSVVQILEDKEYLSQVLEFYTLTIQDFFKILFRTEQTIFKGPYLSKLQRILKENKYDI